MSNSLCFKVTLFLFFILLINISILQSSSGTWLVTVASFSFFVVFPIFSLSLFLFLSSHFIFILPLYQRATYMYMYIFFPVISMLVIRLSANIDWWIYLPTWINYFPFVLSRSLNRAAFTSGNFLIEIKCLELYYIRIVTKQISFATN